MVNDNLMRLNELVQELNTTNSTNDKIEILKKYPDCRGLLSIIYSDFQQFGVTSANVLKLWDEFDFELDDAFDLMGILKTLSSRLYTGHEAIKLVINHCKSNPDYKDLILNALDKNLKCRIDSTLINKALPDCVPTFDVALAKDINKVTKKPDFSKEIYYSSRKLDGLRCVILYTGNEATAFSRTGKEFKTLTKVTDNITDFCKSLGLNNVVFDGEICIVDKNGDEDFTSIMKEYNRKDHTIENPKYFIFDFLTLSEFEAKSGETKLEQRNIALNTLFNTYSKDRKNHIEVLKQTRVIDQSHFESLKAEAAEKGWEGIMIRKNVGYEGKRSNNLMKVKQFIDAEFRVVSAECGPFRVIDKATGLETEIETLTRINIDYKGFNVGVGSGFSLAQRDYFYKNPQEIINKMVTIKYFAESTNEQGGKSLRFPTFKCIREEVWDNLN